MLQLSARTLLEKRLAQSMGLDKYAGIVKTARDNDVSKDVEFQHAFNAFFTESEGMRFGGQSIINSSNGQKKTIIHSLM